MVTTPCPIRRYLSIVLTKRIPEEWVSVNRRIEANCPRSGRIPSARRAHACALENISAPAPEQTQR